MPRLPRFACLALLAGLAGPLSAGTLYQWKDASGVTHVSDKPPEHQKFQERRIDNRAAIAEPAEPTATAENPQCTTARKNLAVLQGKSAVMQDTDGDGKPDKSLDEGERAAQQTLAEAGIKAYCKPASP